MAPPQSSQGIAHLWLSRHLLLPGAGNGNVKALLVTPDAAPEQHHAASYLWPLFWPHAHLDTVSEGLRGAIGEGEIRLQNGTLLNVGYELGGRTGEHQQMPATVFNVCPPGSVFMWMFWPSFNAILVDDRTPERALEVVLSTYLALAASAVTATAAAVLLNPKGTLSLVRHQD